MTATTDGQGARRALLVVGVGLVSKSKPERLPEAIII
jgi:hypothetical protein